MKNLYDDETGVYAVLYESKTQAPILMETEASDSGYKSACKRRDRLLARPDTIRVCIVRVVDLDRYSNGNAALLHMMKAMQNDPDAD